MKKYLLLLLLLLSSCRTTQYVPLPEVRTEYVHDSIYVPVPVEPPPRKSLALSERVRVLGKGCLLGGIGAFVLLLLLRIAARLYLRR